MARLPGIDDPVLRALERSRSVALDEAQSLRRARASELADREAAHADCVRARELAYEEQRKQATAATGFSVQQLQWLHRYVAHQLAQEGEARAAREQAGLQLRQAQDEALRRLEELRVIERLRARRRDEGLRVRARRNQHRLDELGLIKAWYVREEYTWRSVE